jgi:hypothetical protein
MLLEEIQTRTSLGCRNCGLLANCQGIRVSQTPFADSDVCNELHQPYDKTLTGLFLAAAKRGIELAAPEKNAEVLDVACGSSTLALELAPLVRSGGGGESS